MKKVLLVCFIAVMVIMLTGCENKNTESNAGEATGKSEKEEKVASISSENSSSEEKGAQQVVSIYKAQNVDDSDIDIVVGDNYFATQLADMTLNFSQYEGKVVKIEGMSLKNGDWTFVGRYSENAICPTCPAGYAYYEYEWHGKEKLDFGNEKNWIQVTGKLTKGDDNGQEYYYIDAYEIALMNQFGDMATVVN